MARVLNAVSGRLEGSGVRMTYSCCSCSGFRAELNEKVYKKEKKGITKESIRIRASALL